MSIKDCYNIEDFKKLAKKNLPSPIFHYIDGGADDEDLSTEKIMLLKAETSFQVGGYSIVLYCTLYILNTIL